MKIAHYTLYIVFIFLIGATMPTTGNCMQSAAGNLRSLEEEMAILEASGYTETLVAATQANDLERMEQLLRDGANANEIIGGIRPLWWAVFNRSNSAITLLRTYGADPELICNTTTTQTATQFAIKLLKDASIMRPHLIEIYEQIYCTLTQPLAHK